MKKRISLEIIRIIAICMVIFNHTGENGFEMFRTVYGTPLWYIVILLDIVSKAGVPLFFMISGVLLLDKEETLKELFIKRILRYVAIILLFSFIYYVRLYIHHPEYGFSIKYFFTYIYSTPFIIPYWFLYSYLSFLVILPVLRAVVKSLKENEYLWILGFSVFLWISPVWEKNFNLEPININNGLNASFVIFPILGYGIANVISAKYYNFMSRTILFVVFILNWLCSVYMNIVEFQETGELCGSNLDRFAWIPTIVIFYFVVYCFEKKKIKMTERMERVISIAGGGVLCTYLFEDMLRSDIFLELFDIVSGNIARLLMCIPYTVCIIICGVIISTILKKIPGINRLKL